MTEREAAVTYLRDMATAEVPKGMPLNEEQLRMGRAMLLAAADQIEGGEHVTYAATIRALKELEEDK